MPDPQGVEETAEVRHCDGCSCWTDRPVTMSDLLAKWFWVRGEDDDPELGRALFCPDCQ